MREDQKYLPIVTRVNKKIKIVKLRRNSHKLHTERGYLTILKTPSNERKSHLCDTKRVENKNPFLIKCITYNFITF